MKLWLDAQLPPDLARHLGERYGVEATPIRALGLRDATDSEIFDAAKRASVIVVTKDSDFVELVHRLGSPPQVIWVTCGNASNKRLREVFDATFTAARQLLEQGEAVVEIGDGISPD